MAQQHIMEAGPQDVPKLQTNNLVRRFMCVSDWPNIIPRPNLGVNSISPQPHSDLPSSCPISLAVPRSVFIMPQPSSLPFWSPSLCPNQSSTCPISLLAMLNIPHHAQINLLDLPPRHAQINLRHAPICLRRAPIFLIYVQFSPDLPSSIASPPRSTASKFRLKPNPPHLTTDSI